MIQQLTLSQISDDVPPYRLAEDQVVKRRDSVQFVGSHVKHIADVAQRFVRYPSAMPLDDFHGVNANRLLGWDNGTILLRSPVALRASASFEAPSSVYVGQNEINAAENGEQVRNHQPTADHRKHLDVRKRWRANSRAIRDRAAVAHQVIAIISFGRFDRAQRLARRDRPAPSSRRENA